MAALEFINGEPGTKQQAWSKFCQTLFASSEFRYW
jgi:hypothetical protein